MRNLLRYLSLAAAALMATGAHQSQAQIVGSITTNVPFPFYVGETKLPAGEYIFRPLDSTSGNLMEADRPDGTTAALFVVEQTYANTDPQNAEVTFDHLQNRYYLMEIFDPDNPSGERAIDAGYDKMLKTADLADGNQKKVTVHGM